MGTGTRPRIAAAALLAALVLGGVLAMRAVGAMPPPSPSPPFALPNELVPEPAASASPATPFLLVTRGCPWCARELESWSRLAAEGPGILPTVVVVGTGADGDLTWIPDPLRARIRRDPRAELSRAIGVARVPTTLWADTAGVVRRVTTGASPLSLLRRLRSTFRAPEVS